MCGHDDEIGLGLGDGLRQRDGEAVGRVALEQVVLDEQDLGELVRGEFVGEGAHALADDHGGELALRLRRRFAARRRAPRS